MTAEQRDVVVIGAGIVGLAVARAVLEARPGARVVVVDKETEVAAHQTGHNSGVIHSGVYYRPGSLKARLAVEGRRRLVRYCEEKGLRFELCGKVIVAVDEEERDRLRALGSRSGQNGVEARLVPGAELRELEPHAAGVEALHVPGTGIVDFSQVCRALASEITGAGADLRLGQEVTGLREDDRAVRVETSGGEVPASVVVSCAGLWADRVAALHGDRPPDVRVVPFRGEYYQLAPARRHLVRNLVYPVPDPAYPFLGVHLTRGIDGGVHAGPNAVIALARDGYRRSALRGADVADVVSFGGFWRLARAHWRTGAGEMWRSLRPHAFAEAVRRLVPAVDDADLVPAPAGVRAQLVDRSGALADDFVIRQSRRVVDVLNAPSPAATASLAIASHIAGPVVERLS